MKLTEKNLAKHIKDHGEIIDRCNELFQEMGVTNLVANPTRTVFDIVDTNLQVQDAVSKEVYNLPLSYLLDKKEAHLDEQKKKEEKKQRLELNRMQRYIN